MELTDRELSFCWNVLDGLETGYEVLISDYAPNHPDRFIEASKRYHDYYKNLLFSNDYTRIKKTLSFNEMIEKFN